MADASSSVRGLPPPDYIETADEDPTLRVPVVIGYDEWRSTSASPHLSNEKFPQPPAELLVNEDDEPFPEPPPDYDAQQTDNQHYPGLIPPHKLPNPVLESRSHKQIAKDIKFNAKHGVNVLNTKPELEKELERRKLDKQKKELAEQQKKNRNSFEVKLDQQKEKLNLQEKEEKILEEQEVNQSELTRIHNKIKSKSKEPQ